MLLQRRLEVNGPSQSEFPHAALQGVLYGAPKFSYG
jgi:hypothetical protein